MLRPPAPTLYGWCLVTPLVTVRDSRTDECERISALLAASYAEHRSAFTDEMAETYFSEIADVSSRIAAGSSETIVAADGERLLGSVTFFGSADDDVHPWPPNGSALRLLAVEPSERRRGIARLLVDECITRARARGSIFLALHTAPFMSAARALYAAAGFRRAPEHDFDPYGHYSPGAEAPGPDAVGKVQGLAYLVPLSAVPALRHVARCPLPADPMVASAARLAVQQALDATRVDIDLVVLCASELATNALLHGTPPFELELSLSERTLRLAVHDTGSGTVSRRESGPDVVTSGRGVGLVADLSERWGVQPTATGKAVWCEIATQTPDGSASP